MSAYQRQPGFDTGRTPHGSQRFWLLVRGGPDAQSTIGSPTVDDRRLYDIRQFNPLSTTEAVIYLGQYHDERCVLQRWLTVNRERLREQDVTDRALAYALDSQFTDAWSALRDQVPTAVISTDSGKRGGQKQQTQTCPKCGKDGIGNLPTHMRSCDGE